MSDNQLKGNWRNEFGFRFMSSEDFDADQSVTMTISYCTKEIANNPVTKEEKVLVSVHFIETDRMMALNVTNAKSIQSITGTPKFEAWSGVKITVYRDMVKAFGKLQGCLRVKRPSPAKGVDSLRVKE